ncbi:MAG: OPT family oligopeptide transporter [Nannocystaceae bacterium]
MREFTPGGAETGPDPRASLPQGGAGLTLRSGLVGVALGTLFAAGNVYTGLKIGFIDGGAITAALLAYTYFAVLRPKRSYTSAENNVTQAIAAAAGVMGAVAGFAGPIPALEMLGYRFSGFVYAGWGLSLGALGIVIAVFLRRQLVEDEELPFPTGTATAEVIEAASAGGGQAIRRSIALMVAMLFAMVLTCLRDVAGVVPAAFFLPVEIAGVSLAALLVGVGASPLIAATGVLLGVRSGLSLVFGACIAWLVVAPELLRGGVVAEAGFVPLVNWLVWPGVALMVASALTGLGMQWRSLALALRDLLWRSDSAASRDDPGSEVALGPRLLAVLAAVGVLGILGIGWLVFDIHPGLLLVLIAASVVLTAVCARAVGETDVAPVGAVGAVGQIGFGTGGVLSSLAAGSVPAGAGSHAAQMLWTFRAGRLLRSDPRSLVLAQILGSVVGILVAVPTYAVVAGAYEIGTASMPAPGALTWKATAEAMSSGASALPDHAVMAMLVAAFVGVGSTWLARRPGHLRGLLPSPVAMGIGFVMPAYFTGAVLVGVLMIVLLRRACPAWSGRYVVAVAAGGIAGESLMGVALAGAIALGVWAG